MRRLVICIAVLIATPARADDREDARREFAAGQAADRDNSYQAALEHYMRANDLVPHPFTSFNIAVDYERLGKPRDAATWYQRYIDQVSDPAERAKTQRLVDDLRQRPGKLTVESEPSGARVLLDGNPAGHTPFATMVKGGLHHVAIEADGHHEDRDVSTEFGDSQDVSVRLRRADGELMIEGTPAGALVAVDDLPAGTLPTTVNVQPGPHRVHITSYGFQPWDSEVAVEPNETKTVNVQMTRGAGEVDPPRTIQLQYLVGATGGADARGSGAMGLLELGVRYTQYALLVQLGKADGTGFFSLLARWSILPGRLSPYVGLGYIATTSGSDSSNSASGGFEIEGGLHFDILRGDSGSLAAVLSTGAYYYGTTDASGMSSLSIAVPVSLSLEATFGK